MTKNYARKTLGDPNYRYRSNIPAADFARLFIPPENGGKSGVPLNSLRFAAYNNAVKAIWRMCIAPG